MKLEQVDSILRAHPFVKGFDQVSHCLNETEVKAVVQGDISDAVASKKLENIEGKEGARTVYTTCFYIGLLIKTKPRKFILIVSPNILTVATAGSVGTRRLDISYPTNEFTKMVKMWDKYDESAMGIYVRHIKRSVTLPPFLLLGFMRNFVLVLVCLTMCSIPVISLPKSPRNEQRCALLYHMLVFFSIKEY
jgi:poly(A) polymerase